jgi:hypothetical protein
LQEGTQGFSLPKKSCIGCSAAAVRFMCSLGLRSRLPQPNLAWNPSEFLKTAKADNPKPHQNFTGFKDSSQIAGHPSDSMLYQIQPLF